MVNSKRLNSRRYRRKPIVGLAWMLAGLMALATIPAASSMTLAQTASPSGTVQPSPQSGLPIDTSIFREFFSTDTPNVIREDVRLDGRKLFTVASPQTTGSNQASETSSQIRPEIIEDRLQQIVQSNFSAEDLQVTVEGDRTSRLPIIYVRYGNGASERTDELMTVTTLDAQIHGTEPEALADDFAQIVEVALLQAKQERQPTYLRQQGVWSASIFLAMLLGSLFVLALQQRLRRERSVLSAKAQAADQQLATTSLDPSDTGNSTRIKTVLLQQRMDTRQKKGMNEIKRRLLQITQFLIWVGGFFLILGLFPYSRWLQPIILGWLEAPFKIVGIFLITYLLVRLSNILIDRFFLVLQNSTSFAPELSQRTALRFSTFSQVGKSILALLIVGSGIITALSVVGVQVGPLLAGAGIIGLAVSFASQSLIKDMINGFLILLEDQYGVGDVIIVGDVSGLVENMNLRITQLRNEEGRLITVPNSSITIVQNLSKEWSRVDLQVNVGYHADIDQALKVIDEVAQEMSRDRPWRDLILEKPLLLGIDKLDHMGATVRLWIKTQPLKQWEVAREYRRRLKLAFDKAGVPIGVPQQSLWLGNADEFEDELEELASKTKPVGEVKPPGTPNS